MIYHCTFVHFPGKVNVAGFGLPSVLIDPWEILKESLETSKDSFIWIVTRSQVDTFMGIVKKYGLEKYFVVRMDKAEQGVSNRNYPTDRKKLKVFVMKGVG